MNGALPSFGAPGMDPRWTQSTKEGVGTAYHTGCRLWFTISHGIVNEIYYPHVDTPNTRDLQYLITDGGSFCHEERRDLIHEIVYPEEGALLYRLINTDRQGRYRIIKEISTDPHSSVLLQHTRLEIMDESLRGRLKLYVLMAPHLQKTGRGNSAAVCDRGGRQLLHAWRNGLHLVMGATADFTRRSVGYVGHSDGWQDLRNFRMDWEFTEAADGNVAMMAEIDLSGGPEFTLGVAMGLSAQSASAKLLQTLAIPHAIHRAAYVAQWRRLSSGQEYAEHTGDGGGMFRLSRCVLMAHEDKTFSGALVASLSIPWGESKGDEDLGGYHLVWPRDLMQSAVGLLASGQMETPRKALIWMACLQGDDGCLPQNSWIDGRAYWSGLQLDEVAAPLLLAWRLHVAGALGGFDPWTLVSRAAGFLISHGPVTKQERWEEASGYSPSTLAAILGGLVAAAEFAKLRGDSAAADFILIYADWLSAHLEEWTVTACGELLPGKPRHYLRIGAADPDHPTAHGAPDTALLTIANGGGTHPARNVVGTDFLALVRFGLRDPHDPLITDTIAVIDAVLKNDLPQGPGWLRYNHDGYGQKPDGGPFDGAGRGDAWPLLSGERGQYELAAGRDPMPFIQSLEAFANAGGMLPEQVWCGEDGGPAGFRRGQPTGSAMPLCWAHAEYLNLVRSRADGTPFDRIEPAHDRYVLHRNVSTHEIWTPAHRITQIPQGKILRVIVPSGATIRWTLTGSGAAGTGTGEVRTTPAPLLGGAYADLPTGHLAANHDITLEIIPAGEAPLSGKVRILSGPG
ncbi:MAG: glycoside hydrolase family 15 protein [Verrucomicrobiota bacterium]